MRTIFPNNWPSGNWEEEARRFARDSDYYRGLLEQIGKMLGEEAFICDSGDISEDVLIAKIPEIIKKRLGKPDGS